MVGNDGMKNTFERIGLKKFVGFNDWFGWRKKIFGGSSLEKDEKNDWTLPMDDGK